MIYCMICSMRGRWSRNLFLGGIDDVCLRGGFILEKKGEEILAPLGLGWHVRYCLRRMIPVQNRDF